MGFAGEFETTGRHDARVWWWDDGHEVESGPPNVGLLITRESVKQVHRMCPLQDVPIRYFRSPRKPTIALCRSGISRAAAMKGPGGWTYVVRSKYYGGTHESDMIAMLRSLARTPQPTYLPPAP